MKSPPNTEISIQIREKVLNQIRKSCKESQYEIFGYLVGYFNPNENHVAIRSQIYIKNAVMSSETNTYQIEGSAGEFNKQFQKIKEELSDDLLVVGWWHSHINIGCFLSETDIRTQEAFFPEVNQVALVVDPIKDTYAFFTLDENSTQKYRELKYQVVS